MCFIHPINDPIFQLVSKQYWGLQSLEYLELIQIIDNEAWLFLKTDKEIMEAGGVLLFGDMLLIGGIQYATPYFGGICC